MKHDLNKIIQILEEDLSNKRILVVGDIMLDQYFIGQVNRISPEAPVPIVNCNQEENRLGGAANVALNLKKLGCNVTVIGLIGQDDNGKTIEKLLLDEEIDHLLIEHDLPTTTKKRIIANQQQIVRVDIEEITTLNVEVQDQIIDSVISQLKETELVIISDYGKSVCSERVCNYTIKESNRQGIPVIVDPKGPHWKKYSGAKYITPNMKELEDAWGQTINNDHESITPVCIQLKSKYNIDNIAVTRSEHGISFFSHTNSDHYPTEEKEVYDVSGAGDTIVATLTFALLNELEIEDAIYLANLAAGTVIEKLGTYPIIKDELLLHLQSVDKGLRSKIHSKIVDNEELTELLVQWREAGDEIVFTNGCFDLIHHGHITYLEQARKYGDKLIVGLNSDESVKVLKGASRPIIKEQDRALMLASFSFIDAVIIFEDMTPANLIKLVKPDLLVKGGDYTVDTIVGAEHSKRVKIIPFIDGYSTTNLINHIQSLGSKSNV
ncbi:D-glycero-beta-D-manno-heptose-7-phosphate kinase [Evansella sp. AB-P1]|uniref:D-glycero-beta-D-manno-heptose-7-phosphate kinase n=1 Tax=Evansella sp. AB-P1 TaxID=3037653 RepID=UPI00241E7620|nr:D-glycero-beta-D-manno-heptose-7-phosphate kinase [Evansella sp. AB-P1]MDG5788345.1 D-glycero-beta-D-manno-heptose-7-phosphate kinase [Evansella sp. AB-P1]